MIEVERENYLDGPQVDFREYVEERATASMSSSHDDGVERNEND